MHKPICSSIILSKKINFLKIANALSALRFRHKIKRPQRGVLFFWRRRRIPSPRRWRGCGAFLTVLLYYVCKTYSLSNPAIADCERFVHTTTPTGIKNTPCGVFFIPGGDEGIRTLDTLAGILHFQCSALDQLCDISESKLFCVRGNGNRFFGSNCARFVISQGSL